MQEVQTYLKRHICKSLLERKRVELFDVVDVDGLRMREGGGTETDHSRRDRGNGHIIDLGGPGSVIHQKDEEARMEGGRGRVNSSVRKNHSSC